MQSYLVSLISKNIAKGSISTSGLIELKSKGTSKGGVIDVLRASESEQSFFYQTVTIDYTTGLEST